MVSGFSSCSNFKTFTYCDDCVKVNLKIKNVKFHIHSHNTIQVSINKSVASHIANQIFM